MYTEELGGMVNIMVKESTDGKFTLHHSACIALFKWCIFLLTTQNLNIFSSIGQMETFTLVTGGMGCLMVMENSIMEFQVIFYDKNIFSHCILIFLQKKMEKDTVANMKRALEQAMGHITIQMEDHLLELF